MVGQIEKSSVIKYLLAGNAILTVRNEQTGNRFTYKITELSRAIPGHEKTEIPSLWFVKVLTGEDNTSMYSFIGSNHHSKNFTSFRHSPKSHINKDAQSVKVFDYIFRHLLTNQLPEFITFYHEGRCGRCGKKLTVPESVISGYGPECINFI
jgi:hypothetical protein